MGVVQHQIKHISFGHIGSLWRLRDKNRSLANIAYDLAVNSTIRDSDEIVLPKGCLRPAMYGLPSGETSQWYYNTLQTKLMETLKKIMADIQAGDIIVNDLFLECDPIIIATLQEYLLDAADKANGIGNQTSDMSQLIQIQQKNRINWKRVLKNKLNKVSYITSDDIIYTKNRLSKRYGTVPGIKRQHKQNSILCMLDVSGSMSDKTISKVLGQINSLFKVFKDVTVLQFDTEIKAIQDWKIRSQFQRKGNGGTVISNQIIQVINCSYKNHKKIILTDGQIYGGDIKRIDEMINGNAIWVITKYKQYKKYYKQINSVYFNDSV